MKSRALPARRVCMLLGGFEKGVPVQNKIWVLQGLTWC